MKANTLLDIQGLSFRYGTSSVLKDVHAHFHRQRFSVILGSNGSGKSTLLRIIAGLLSDYSGKIIKEGRDLRTYKGREKASFLGFLPQFYQSVFPYSVEQVLLTGRSAFNRFGPKRSDYERLKTVLQELGIEDLKHKDITRLSGGQQQLVQIGRLLMQEPELLLLDEPTNHLDVYYQNHLMQKLNTFVTQGGTVIAVMHDPTLAYRYAENFFFMHEGQLKSSESHAPDPSLLQEVYGVPFLHLDTEGNRIVLPGKLT